MDKFSGREMPVFPLATVLFPAGDLSLRIFEPRYLDMVSRCSREQQGFVVVAIKQGTEAGAPATPYGVGTEVEILDWDKDDDGLLLIECRGVARVSLGESRLLDDGLRLAQVVLLEPDAADVVPECFQAFWKVLQQCGVTPETEDQRTAAWLSGRLAECLPLSLQLKQALLTLDDPLLRLAEIDRHLQASMKA